MDKQLLGTYSVPWESDTDWEPGLWTIYTLEDDPDTVVVQHEYADEEWGTWFVQPEKINISHTDGPVAAGLHYYYTQKGFRAHSFALVKWQLRGAIETTKNAVRASGEAVAYWTVDYVIPFMLSMFGVAGFFVSSFGMFGSPEYFIYHVALFAASIWALLRWPEWLGDFLALLLGWIVIAAIVAYPFLD